MGALLETNSNTIFRGLRTDLLLLPGVQCLLSTTSSLANHLTYKKPYRSNASMTRLLEEVPVQERRIKNKQTLKICREPSVRVRALAPPSPCLGPCLNVPYAPPVASDKRHSMRWICTHKTPTRVCQFYFDSRRTLCETVPASCRPRVAHTAPATAAATPCLAIEQFAHHQVRDGEKANAAAPNITKQNVQVLIAKMKNS